ncbi:hypothetical protein Tco_0892367 [Tanacetum coccineum]|uniref:Retrotransposon gag domain-containing protein n=1 Tax=Tanacetum coccineum TaxID=301880 RepID=A0ABQ5C619_9ASTR
MPWVTPWRSWLDMRKKDGTTPSSLEKRALTTKTINIELIIGVNRSVKFDMLLKKPAIPLHERTTKLRNDILMFQQHQGESLSEAWTHFNDLLKNVPHHGIDLWLQVQIFYDHIDQTLKRTMDYAAEGRLRKMSAKKAWATIEELARYEDEGWNDPVFPGEEGLDYKNLNIEQLLGVMECKVDMLMKNAIPLMRRSEDVCGMMSDMMRQLQTEPSRQEAFEDLMMNFILDQEEKVKQLEEYMSVIRNDFMQHSLEVIAKLREEIRVEENRVKKIEKITRYPDTEDLEPLSDCKFLETLTKKHPSILPNSSRFRGRTVLLDIRVYTEEALVLLVAWLLLDNMTFENSDEGGESTQELQNLIKELGYRNAMDVEDVLTHPEENVVAQLLTDEEIIESVIGINKDDIDEEDDESSTMEPPSRNEAIKAAITLNNFLLSYEKTTPEVLTMLRKIRDEIQGEIDFNKKQKTIESFFKKPS